jgi:hypothetical protein
MRKTFEIHGKAVILRGMRITERKIDETKSMDVECQQSG